MKKTRPTIPNRSMMEHDRAMGKAVIGMLSDHTELFKQFSDNPDFKKWLADTIFGVTYEEAAS